MKRRRGLLVLLALQTLLITEGCESRPTAVNDTSPAASISRRVSEAKSAISRKPDFENYISLGLALSESGAHEEALESFRSASRLKADSPIAFNDICAELNHLKRWVPAVVECKRALQLAPEMTLAKNNLAYAEASKRQDDAKLAELRSGVDRAKDPDLVRINIGQGLYEQGAYEEAISEWRKVGDQSKRFALAQNNIGSALIFLSRFADAKQAIERALALEPANPLFKNNERWLAEARVKSQASH